MNQEEKCPLCENICEKQSRSNLNEQGQLVTGHPKHEYFCSLCGNFVMSYFVLSKIKDEKYKDKLFIISGHIKNQNLKGKEVEIKAIEDIDNIINSYYPKTPRKKLEHLITYLGNHVDESFGQPIKIDLQKDGFIIFSRFSKENEESKELRNIIDAGVKYGYIEKEKHYGVNDTKIILSFEGHKKYEELKNSNVNSKICFVAMEFDEENRFKKLYESSIKKALSKALEGKFEPYCLIDKQHNGLIDDAIIAGINKSRFMIAEFSTQNRGVYFEVGYAEGRKIEVIKICDQKILDEKKLHFDIEHYNFIGYNNPADLERKLINRIEARFF